MRSTTKITRPLAYALLVLGVFWVAISPAFADAAWASVIPGVDQRQFRYPGPNRIFVTRMDRHNPNLVLESGLPWGTLRGERQTVSDMASRYDQSLSAWGGTWGARSQVVAAINGSYFDLGSGEPNNGMIVGGWYTKMFSDLGGWSGLAWKADRSVFIGACVDHGTAPQTVTNLITGQRLEIDGINHPVGANQLVVFTPQYDAFSPGQKNGVEIIIGLYQPLGLRKSSESTIGTVLSVHRSQGSLPIPFDAVVLSAQGAATDDLLNAVRVGDVLSFSLQLQHYEANCRTPSRFDWAGTYTSLGGTLPFLREGEILEFQDEGASQRHPRTAVCFNDDWLYFVVVDGRRSSYSVGMTIPELATFCKETLSATWGVNQDGGGSSTLWVNGEVVNRPSDGDARHVANSLMIVQVLPMERSKTLRSNGRVVSRYATNVHLGPGTNYPAITSVASGTEGLVIPNLAGLNGVQAKGAYWWKVDFNGIQGWVDEAAIEYIATSNGLSAHLTPASFKWPFP